MFYYIKLKCNIIKYYPSINHNILLNKLKKAGFSNDEMWFLEKIIRHTLTDRGKVIRKLRLSAKKRLKKYLKILSKPKSKEFIDSKYVSMIKMFFMYTFYILMKLF